MKKLPTEIRRRQLAEATIEAVQDLGLGGLTVAEVARRTGLVPSALYRHFRGKGELIGLVLSLVGERLHGFVSEAAGHQGNSIEQLHWLLRRHCELVVENEVIPRMVLSEETWIDDSDRRDQIRGIVNGYLDGVAGIIREGQERGEIAPAVNPSVAARMFFGLIQPSIILWQLNRPDFDLVEEAEAGWHIFASRVLTPSET